MRTYFDTKLTSLYFRLIFFPIAFFVWHLLNPSTFTISQAIIYSLSLSVGSILLAIIIDYKTNCKIADEVKTSVEKIYQARYEIRWSTGLIRFYGSCFEGNLEIEIHNVADAKLKKEAKEL